MCLRAESGECGRAAGCDARLCTQRLGESVSAPHENERGRPQYSYGGMLFESGCLLKTFEKQYRFLAFQRKLPPT